MKTFIKSTILGTMLAGMVVAQELKVEAGAEVKAEVAGATVDAQAQAQMEAWMKAASPNEKHKALEFEIGNFDASSKFWMSPDAPPQESKATCTNEWALGGRFVATRYQGEMQGKPFDGIGYLGHDNVAGEYVSIWMDSISTGIFYGKGMMSGDGKVLTINGEMKDPATGQTIKSRAVTTKNSDDQHTFEMFDTDASGKERKTLEIVYTRKK